MHVTSRDFIYDVILVFRKYFVACFNDILYHKAILRRQKLLDLDTTQRILYQELCLAGNFLLKTQELGQ